MQSGESRMRHLGIRVETTIIFTQQKAMKQTEISRFMAFLVTQPVQNLI